MDLSQWRKHIDQVVKDEGQWVGVADENGYPIYELTGKINFPESHLQAASAEITVNVEPGDRILDDLVGDSLGQMDAAGRLVPANGPARLLVLVRPGERRAATITHVVVTGQATPSQVTAHGVDLLDSLASWPCPSINLQGWETAEWQQRKTDASGVRYGKVREMAQLQFATKLFRYAQQGTARDLLRVITQDSFDSVNILYGWDGDPHAVVDFSGDKDTSGEIGLRISDDSIWETIAESARSAGLTIDVELWWPGDPAIRVRADHDGKQTKAKTFAHPVQVVRIEQLEGV